MATEAPAPAPAPSPAPTPAPAPSPAPGPAPAPAPAPGVAWLPADADAELVGHVQNQAWQSPADAAKAHRELQKLFGADRHGRTVTLPKDDATPDEVKAFRTKLGVPEKPEDYGLPVPQGDDGKFAGAMSQLMHRHGVPKSAAQGMAAEWNAWVAQQQTEAAQAEQAALQAEHQTLAAKWGTGPAADRQREVARRFALAQGMDEPAIAALEKAVGYSKTMQLFAKMGELTGEHTADGMDQSGSFSLTPSAALAKRDSLMADGEWTKRASKMNSAEWREMTRLNLIIADHMEAQQR